MTEAGPREARFNRVYELHLDAVRAYAWRRAPGVADEVVAETFLVAWRRLEEVPVDALPLADRRRPQRPRQPPPLRPSP
jgi:DNA-directed RNA polymerase specialized sigma24 family protein